MCKMPETKIPTVTLGFCAQDPIETGTQFVGKYFELTVFANCAILYEIKNPDSYVGTLCPEQESNLHTLWAADFESAASTNSAIWANHV